MAGFQVTTMSLNANITCPHCRNVETATMPDDACVFFFECPNCKNVLRPLPGDCCVFCSYGDHKCPPSLAAISVKRKNQ